MTRTERGKGEAPAGHRVPALVLASLVTWPLAACGAGSGGRDMPNASGGSAGDASGVVQIGVPSGEDGLSFAPLVDDAELRLETFGQGGTHVLLGVRCIGFGSRAYVSITLRDSNTGVEVVAPAPARPQLLFCTGPDCDLVPITVMAGGLTKTDEERDGLPIGIRVDVHNEAGVSGSATGRAILSTADL